MPPINQSDIITTVSYRGQSSIGTLDGTVRIEQAQNRIVVRDPITKKILTSQDGEGFKVNDNLERQVSRLDGLGLTTTEPSTGRERIRVGVARSDGRAIIAATKPGIDLRNQGV